MANARRDLFPLAGKASASPEALRAYFVERLPSQEVAERFGYSPGAFRALCHEFRHDQERQARFFKDAQRGPHGAPKRDPVREAVIHTNGVGFSVNAATSQPSGGGSSNIGVATLSTATGGTVSLGGGISVMIPAGALGTFSATVAVQATSSPPASSSGLELLGTVYGVTVNGQDHYTFHKPVTLTFTFDPSQVPSGATPAVYYYDGPTGHWVDIGGTVSGDTITVTVDHFTEYAVMAQFPTPPASAAVTPKDIAGTWAQAAIERLVSLGAITGYPDGTFRPDNPITRAEFVTVLVKALKLAPKAGPVFADAKGNWAEGYISTAAAYGIASGYNASHFGPNDLITREQMVVLVVRVANPVATNAVTSFSDAAMVDPWATEAVATAVKSGIVNGYPDGTFRPQGNATRAEAVTVIASLLK